MADQNPQVNQNVNNQNENDELFGGSDDIFENSDLLQPINSEIDSAHNEVKSQNDLNNFSGEIQSNSQDNISDNFEKKGEQQNNLEQPENIENDDLFEQPKPEQSYDDHFENLYDDSGDKDDKGNTDDLGANDDIFDSPVTKENAQEEPEILDHIDEPQEEIIPEQETQPEKVEEQPQEELYPVEDVSEKKDEEEKEVKEKKEEQKEENIDEEEEDFDDDIDDIDDLDDEDEEEDDEEYEDVDDVKNEDKVDNKEVNEISDSNEHLTSDDEEIKVKPNEDEEDEEENDTPIEKKDNEEESDEYFDDFGEEEDQEETSKTDEEEKENIIIQDYEKYDSSLFKTDVQKKFGELQWKTEQIHKLVGKDLDVGFDLLGGNDDRQKTIYKILSGEDYVEIEKEELNKEDESTTSNLLEFVLEGNNLEIYVNDILLYNEIPDLQNDPNKKMQVLEKMNKFIFLLDEEYKKIQKYKKEKEERNAVKGVFRNF